jgi:biotin synthase
MDHDEILSWLAETDVNTLETLWRRADETRRRHVGDAVHLRGLVEFSNHCARQCGYCGIRAGNPALVRYRMSADEILECARLAVRLGYGTVVLQSGEDPGTTRAWMAGVIRRIKAETGLAVTLGLGERSAADMKAWRAAGADRYLLRFETSNPDLFQRIHPPRAGRGSDRIVLLRRLRDLGYEVGSGGMIGIPGQTLADLARDLELFRELDLDMIGVGPFLPHPGTPLGRAEERETGRWGDGGKENERRTSNINHRTPEAKTDERRPPTRHSCSKFRHAPSASQKSAIRNPQYAMEQVPNSELMTYKVVALARVLCPDANIPSTTALATLNRETGRELGLQRGANVLMPNLTPLRYRRCYEIYPAKSCLYEEPETYHAGLMLRLASIGRPAGTGPGASPRFWRR